MDTYAYPQYYYMKPNAYGYGGFWCYELWDLYDRLLAENRGFATPEAAKSAARQTCKELGLTLRT